MQRFQINTLSDVNIKWISLNLNTHEELSEKKLNEFTLRWIKYEIQMNIMQWISFFLTSK